MKDLINLHDKILIFEINKHLKEHNKNTINYDILVCLNDIVKGVDTIETKFNFIDIIKGFVPLSLSEIIFVLTWNREDTKLILYKYKQKFVSNVNFFWKRHCVLVKEYDKNLGIDKKSLKKHKGTEKGNLTRTVSNIPKFEGLLGVKNHIYFGNKPLGFTIYMDLASLVKCFLALLSLLLWSWALGVNAGENFKE
jgi:hypothetical protein